MATTEEPKKRLPNWLRRELPPVSALKTHETLGKYKLNTVCESALCPNRSECYSQKTATFMILGDVCTRSCGFCAIKTGPGLEVEGDEPERVANAAKEMGLRYIVLTSVARDDLPDEGAEHFAKTVLAVRAAIEGCEIEVLTPDFHGKRELIKKVTDARPEVYNHNVETVIRLQKEVRVQATFERSLSVLKTVKELDSGIQTKSGLMLGLGETREEILETAKHLADVGCDILTLGQYLPPSGTHLPLKEYVSPEFFDEMAEVIKPFGFKDVFAGPYVRSSYHAGEVFDTINK